jgi:nucleotide-binding universal stress UspA family protein
MIHPKPSKGTNKKGRMKMLPLKKILCATDFSELSYEAIKAASELALHFSAELCLLHVVPLVPLIAPAVDPTMVVMPVDQEEKEISSKKLLDEVAQKWISEKLNVHTMIAQGQAAEQITRVAEEGNADLIILGTHGLKGLDHLIFGSVAEKVVRTSQLPVLTIQAQNN